MGSVYLAYRELAEHLEALEQQQPAIKYYGKCLDIARRANHRGLQIEVRTGVRHKRLVAFFISFVKQLPRVVVIQMLLFGKVCFPDRYLVKNVVKEIHGDIGSYGSESVLRTSQQFGQVAHKPLGRHITESSHTRTALCISLERQ